MFFAGITAILIFLITGIYLLVKGEYAGGSVMAGIGIVLIIVMYRHYHSRRKKKDSSCDEFLDCDCTGLGLFRAADCDKLDCTPDCTH
ncbi:hypothetical protein [Peribacillus sp. SCS-37]|uniref:hypothetical protein n=1 Tax=Paraperibacillus esterisolvens TaxID=3115296 RepID=UPI00390633AF